MSTVAQSSAAFVRTSSGPNAGAPGIIARLAAKVRFELRVRRDLRLLRSFDDAMLRDIGLQRSGIEHALRHGHRRAAQVTLLPR